jgi:hypothetical protein
VWFTMQQPTMRERLIRWDTIKLEMLWGCLRNDRVYDELGGRVMCIPLLMAVQPLSESAVETKQGALLSHREVQKELYKLWEEMCLRGGIDQVTFFGYCKMVYGMLLPHLSDRELHQLITVEVELDYPEAEVQMSKPQFFRWIGALSLIWVESCSVSEIISFISDVAAILTRPIECFDTRFFTNYSRKDPSLLIPYITTKQLADVDSMLLFVKQQVALSVRVRFGSLLSEAPITDKARIKKRTKAQADKGFGLFMAPEAEERAALGQLSANEEAVFDDVPSPASGAGSDPPPASAAAAAMRRARLSSVDRSRLLSVDRGAAPNPQVANAEPSTEGLALSLPAVGKAPSPLRAERVVGSGTASPPRGQLGSRSHSTTPLLSMASPAPRMNERGTFAYKPGSRLAKSQGFGTAGSFAPHHARDAPKAYTPDPLATRVATDDPRNKAQRPVPQLLAAMPELNLAPDGLRADPQKHRVHWGGLRGRR